MTNGAAFWGTLEAVTPESPVQRSDIFDRGLDTPWCALLHSNANPTNSVPSTEHTVYYKFDVSEMTIAPDGVQKDGIVVNGAFPGPMISANWGDWIEVEVTNHLKLEGTSIHWHGIKQKSTPWMDGVPSFQQCPIAPNSSFTYRFRADVYGTSWWHAHYSAQNAGGAFGPIVIKGPSHGVYDYDLGPVMLSDWWHASYIEVVDYVMSDNKPATQPPPKSNNNLINGKMNYPCANTTLPCTPNAGIAKFKFVSGKRHLLRLINTSAEGLQKFSIDGHSLTVIANDMVPVDPYTTNVMSLAPGQRADVVVEATMGSNDAVWMRSSLAKCAQYDGVSPNAVAAIYYESANVNNVPTTHSQLTTAEWADCSTTALNATTPLCAIPVPDPTAIEDINFDYQYNGTNWLWVVNNSSFRGDYNDPVFLEAKAGNLKFEPERNVYDFGANKSIRMIVYNWFEPAPHPMHLHGHDVYILQEGFGAWDGSIVNPQNPIRRDTFFVQAAADNGAPAYTVVQFDMDNPGVWPLHCHIAWHMTAGLYISVLERPDDIVTLDVPESSKETCKEWAVFTGQYTVNQTDSGLWVGSGL
ncbi:multicopper oxidase [Saccharata proteae CBS 121410]|uniref:Multicopper oxidase n=1 Tax=Saccharata proteae CBS 121410 TaxID=1314787 RepID=A0A9P4HU14_9PEZI|nr:multicopper oxidase [Saccharata proteae CBS 121410]